MQAGLTGLAQVSGLRGDTSIADRARFDNASAASSPSLQGSPAPAW
jgi:lipopolysaccharide/colanic/teichoic acid biosynthesis glycosyltransferase